MKRMMMFVAMVLCSSVAVQAVTWDVLDETYGDGEGQVSFVQAYSWPWSDVPDETLYDGYASVSTGAGIDYACRANGTINLPTDSWRLDVTMELPGAMGFSFYLGDTDNAWSKALVQVNALYSETAPHPDVISDYNARDPNAQITPEVFDGTVVHTYSFRYYQREMRLYVDGAYVTDLLTQLVLGDGVAGVDNGYEACQFGIGASQSAGPGVCNIYSVKIASQNDPEFCGDWGTVYLPLDMNEDCVVSLPDFAIFAADWMKCTDPADAFCDEYWKAPPGE